LPLGGNGFDEKELSMAALEGMRILDMTQYEAGPSCTQALAWLGADVVKIERPVLGDPSRRGGRQTGRDSEYYVTWNSNKKSLTLSLEKKHGRDLLLQLLPGYDVFVENFGPGVIEKLDIGYDVMSRIHPEIIYARIKGFGTYGPYAGYKCFDMVAQAAAGAYSVTGEADGPPMQPGPTTGDSGTGIQMALAIAAAYIQKLRSGRGQQIEISMQEAMLYYMRTAIAAGSNWGRRAVPRTGNGLGAAINVYPCSPRGPNDYISIVAVTPAMWAALCRTIGREDLLDDSRFQDKTQQERNQANKAAVSEWTKQHDKKTAMKILAEAGVPVSAVWDTRDLFQDPHLQARNFIHTVDHPDYGPVPILGWGPQMSDSHVPLKAAPQLGEHTRDVLMSELGLTDDDIERLYKDQVI